MKRAYLPERESILGWLKQVISALILTVIAVGVSAYLLKLTNTDKEKEYVLAVTGSLYGGVIAFFIARWQLRKEQYAERARNRELLTTVIKQVAIEVRDNRNKLKKLRAKLDGKDLGDKLTWGYAYAITQGLRIGSYDLLVSSGLAPYALAKDLEVLYDCYSSQDGVIALVREVHTMSEYNLSESEREEVVRLGQDVITNNSTVISQFESRQTEAFLKRHLP